LLLDNVAAHLFAFPEPIPDAHEKANSADTRADGERWIAPGPDSHAQRRYS